MIYIFGYYFENNIGDNQFIYTMPYALKKINDDFKLETFEFVNHQTIHKYIPFFKTTDIIVLGGGDVLTNFFLDKLDEIREIVVTRLIAFSVGTSYISELNHPVLKYFESFYMRTFQDTVVMKKLFGDIITVVPDTSFFLPDISLQENCDCDLQYKSKFPMETVLVCLNQHSRDQFPVVHFAKLLDAITDQYHIVFIPFCTGRQDDFIIHNDIKNEMKTTNYTLFKKTCLDHTIKLFKTSKYSIVMRFHALMFSYIWDVNFLVLSETRKTLNFCIDVQLHGEKKLTMEKLKNLNQENFIKRLTMEFEKKIKYSDWLKMCL